MFISDGLQAVVLFDECRFLVAQPGDAVLRLVAVYHGDVNPHHVVDVVGYERGNGRFADTAFLCCECNECFLVHFSVCFNRCWFMTVAVCLPACSFLRFLIYAQTHFLAYPHFYGGLGLVPHRCAVVRRYVNTSARMYVNASVRMYVSTSAERCVCPSVRTCLFKCLFPSMFIYLPCCFIVSVRKGIYKSAGLYRFPLAWQHLALFR